MPRTAPLDATTTTDTTTTADTYSPGPCAGRVVKASRTILDAVASLDGMPEETARALLQTPRSLLVASREKTSNGKATKQAGKARKHLDRVRRLADALTGVSTEDLLIAALIAENLTRAVGDAGKTIGSASPAHDGRKLRVEVRAE